jgi:exodeoxyribonuclease VII small subunit
VAEPSFEEALDTLEKIVGELEEGNLPLDETLKRFEQGIKLARLCEKKLQAARKKVSMLTRDDQGELKEMPFTASEDADSATNEAGEGKSLFDD